MNLKNAVQHIVRYFVTLGTVLAFVLTFQNCSRVNFGTGAPKSAKQTPSSAGNGTNYDGKPYDHVDTARPCADKSPNRHIIVLGTSGYKMVRKDCSNLNPAINIPNSDIKVDSAHPAILTYNQEKYIFDASVLAAQPADLDCKNKNFGPLQSVKIYSTTGASGAMLVGVASFNGASYNVAFDKTALDTSASATLDAINQESDLNFWLSGFNPANPYPDQSNSKYGYSQGALGGNGHIHCLRPSGKL